MLNSSFLSHGCIDITVDNDLVIMDVEGPCNKEFFELMTSKLVSLRPQINMNNCTGLVVLHGEALATPDAMAYFTNYLTTVQVRAIAINLQYAHTPSITQEICAKAYSDAAVKHCFFYDNQSAITWLRNCMATPE